MKTLLGILLLWLPVWAQTPGELYEKNCASCHRTGSPTHAPAPEALRQMSRGRILDALNSGKMMLMAAGLPIQDRMAIAAYLGTAEPEEVSGGKCTTPPAPLKDLNGWQGWSVDPENSRFESSALAG